MLRAGSQVALDGGGWVRVDAEIGRGAEGAVLGVSGQDGREYALKWYAGYDEARHALLSYLIGKGSPGARFLWPLCLAHVPGQPGFGYLMHRAPARYVELVRYAAGTHDADAAAVIRCCLQLARSFQRLHAQGLCYRDISLRNVLFDAHTGDILVCDNDNVGIDNGSGSSVLGTPSFMAPELLRGLGLPSAATDLHSLAVALFWILTLTHPLEGQKTERGMRGGDLAWEREHFGRDPVFVFDPADARNRPADDSLADLVWEALPGSARALFTEAFTLGLTNPGARVMESQWTRSMRALRDALLWCPGCRGARFADRADAFAVCHRCGAPQPPARWLATRAGGIVVGRHTRLWTDHFGVEPDEATAIGEFDVHPDDPSRWALRNVSDEPWHAAPPGGREHRIDPGRGFECLTGARVRFPLGEGTVVE